MVTLIGFFFIIGNVALLEIYMPDLIGPVSGLLSFRLHGAFGLNAEASLRVHHGCIIALLLACGCEQTLRL